MPPYQVADNDFRSGLNGQVEGGELGCVLDPGVDVSLDADEEQHAFNVGILDGHVEEVTALVVDLTRKHSWKSTGGRNWLKREDRRLRQHLLGGAGLPLDDGLRCLVVLVRHGAGEGGHSLAVPDVEANVRVGNEELYDDTVLVADGNVDGCSAFRILADG